MSVFFIQDQDAGRDTCAVKEIGRQADDALDITTPQDFLANTGLGTAPKQYAVRMNDCAFAGALKAGQDVQQEGVISVLLGWDSKLEAFELVFSGVQAIAPGFG